MRRKTPSLFGKLLQTSLKNEPVWLKAEDLPSFLPFYVDQGHLQLLLDNANQLIVGRRGTGKTHLLGAFREFVTQEREGDACVNISILEAYPQTPPTIQMESDAFASIKVANEIYLGFLRVFFKRFLDTITARLKNMENTYPPAMYSEMFISANDRLTQLLEAIEVGRQYPIRRYVKSNTVQVEAGGKNAAIGIEADLANFKPALKANVGLSAKKNDKNTKNTNTELESLLSIDLFDVRELVLDILDISKIGILYILIDEWIEPVPEIRTGR